MSSLRRSVLQRSFKKSVECDNNSKGVTKAEETNKENVPKNNFDEKPHKKSIKEDKESRTKQLNQFSKQSLVDMLIEFEYKYKRAIDILDQLKSTIAQVSASHSKEREDLLSSRNKIMTDFYQTENEKLKLEDEIETTKKKNAELEKQLTENNAAESKSMELQQQNTKISQLIEQLKQQQVLKETRYQQQIDELNAKETEYKQRIEQLEQEVQEKNSVICEKEHQIDKLQNEISEKDNIVSSESEKAKQFEKELEELKKTEKEDLNTSLNSSYIPNLKNLTSRRESNLPTSRYEEALTNIHEVLDFYSCLTGVSVWLEQEDFIKLNESIELVHFSCKFDHSLYKCQDPDFMMDLNYASRSIEFIPGAGMRKDTSIAECWRSNVNYKVDNVHLFLQKIFKTLIK